MNIISLDDLIIPNNRQRKKFDPGTLDMLVESIASKGLFHPIVCGRNLLIGAHAITLVAGERRVRAVKILSQRGTPYMFDGQLMRPNTIPYVLLDLDDVSMREAELEENIIRVDLAWPERVAALNELHELHTRMDPKQSVSSTARGIAEGGGGNVGTLENEIAQARIIAPHLDDPDVARAKSAAEASRIASKKIEREFLQLTAERAKASGTMASPHTLIVGRLQDKMPGLIPSKFKTVIADPPYGIDAGDFGDAAKLAHYYEDDRETALLLAKAIFSIGHHVAMKNSFIFMFCDVENFVSLRNLAEHAGWKPFRTPLMWSKGPSGHAPWNDRGFRRQYETLLYAIKGSPILAELHSDILEVPNLRDKDYAAQKPPALYELLLRLTCAPSDYVLDPCCGAGTIFTAATATHTIATGIEIDPDAVAMCERAILGNPLEDF